MRRMTKADLEARIEVLTRTVNAAIQKQKEAEENRREAMDDWAFAHSKRLEAERKLECIGEWLMHIIKDTATFSADRERFPVGTS